MEKFLIRVIRVCLWATLAIPVVLWSAHIYPQVFVRTTFFQFLIEASVLAALTALFISALRGRAVPTFLPSSWWRSPLLLTTFLFFGVSAFASALFALDTQRAWFGVASWGNEGVLMYIHYLAFVLLALAFFSRKDWLRYLFGSIAVGTVVALFAVLQFVGVDPLGLMPKVGRRVGSFLENPTYLAGYLVALLSVAGVALRHGGLYEFLPTTIRPWATRFLVGFVVLALLVIVLTQTRGALVGVVAGALVFLALVVLRSPQSARIQGISLRTLGIASAVAILAFGGIFWTTRQAPIWDTIPVFSRLARISTTDSTVATRLISLQISWDAFKERPILGWGPDNSYIAHTKYYRPELFSYEETWFERMHNKIAEVAVTQGVIGLLSFAALWVFLSHRLWREVRAGEGVAQLASSSLVAGGLVAYLGQNMFAFDLPTSYIIFFSLLIFYIREEVGEASQGGELMRGTRRGLVSAASVLAVPFVLYVFMGFTLIPFQQSSALVSGLEGGAKKFEGNGDAIYSPSTHIQRDIEHVAILELQEVRAWEHPEFSASLARLADETAVRVESNPYDARTATLLGIFLLDIGDASRAEHFGRLGLERAPRRPDSYHAAGRSLMQEGKFDEAQSIFRQGIALNNSIATSHFYYATSLALEDSARKEMGSKDEALAEYARAQELKLAPSPSRYDTIGSAFFTYKEWEQLDALMKQAIDEYDDYSRLHQLALAAALNLQDRENAIAQAKSMKVLNASNAQLITRLDRIIGFVENNNWAAALREMGIE